MSFGLKLLALKLINDVKEITLRSNLKSGWLFKYLQPRVKFCSFSQSRKKGLIFSVFTVQVFALN